MVTSAPVPPRVRVMIAMSPTLSRRIPGRVRRSHDDHELTARRHDAGVAVPGGRAPGPFGPKIFWPNGIGITAACRLVADNSWRPPRICPPSSAAGACCGGDLRPLAVYDVVYEADQHLPRRRPGCRAGPGCAGSGG